MRDDKRILEIEVNTNGVSDLGYFIWLKRGYCFEYKGRHCMGITSKTEIPSKMVEVKECDCGVC